MDTILRLIIPLLPAQAGEIATSLTPLLTLLSSPTQLLWYISTNPSRILTILGTTGTDLFNALRRLDFSTASGDKSALGAILPFVVGAVGLYMAAISLMSTFRTAWGVIRRLIRWGTIIGVIVGAFGLLTGGRGGGGGDQGGGGLAIVLGPLMGLLGGNNAGGGGLYQQAFGMARDYALGNTNNNNNGYNGYNPNGGDNQAAGLMSTLWNTFSGSSTNNNNNNRDAPVSGRTRSSKSNSRNPTTNAAGGTDIDGLTDMAQKFVKEAFLKENPLSSWLGTVEKSKAEQKREAKEKEKERLRNAKAKGRGW